jgi:CheY-like chemotaxis protein
MVIDDSAIVTQLTAFIMEQLGYEAIQFTDGQSALDYLNSNETTYPDLIVCDHYLGSRSIVRKNGFKILKKLSQFGVDIPVIIASGATDQRIVDKYYDIGVIGYVSKDTPNYIDELERNVIKVIKSIE